MDEEQGTRTVELPEAVVSTFEARVEYTEFATVDEYIAFALDELGRNLDSMESGQKATVDEDEVEDRLKSLGYL
jgi:Arc/MetJ-type ribon-helix-helix transcriptional regulator